MYKFELFDLNNVNMDEYEEFEHKSLFTTITWLHFLKEWKNVEPLMIRIVNECGDLIGYFTAAQFSKLGFKVIGSPFYGWMGQHMGFDFVDESQIRKSELLDELILYINNAIKPSFLIFADFKYSKEDIEQCKTALFHDTDRYTYYLDLTQSEEQMFKNFKSGYRTCVRKFEKMGGTIVEDNSDEFIEVHHTQLAEVFGRKEMTPPNYRERMKLLYHSYPNMVLSIKALDENGNNIASSYYLGGGSMAFFASNASLTDALKYNANQALMWYAIRYWKSKGIRTLDLAGRADYKKNFGPELYGTPTVVWAKHRWEYSTVMWLRNKYYESFRLKYKIKDFFTGKKAVKADMPKENTQASPNEISQETKKKIKVD